MCVTKAESTPTALATSTEPQARLSLLRMDPDARSPDFGFAPATLHDENGTNVLLTRQEADFTAQSLVALLDHLEKNIVQDMRRLRDSIPRECAMILETVKAKYWGVWSVYPRV